MTAKDYRAALKTLGWSHIDAARFLDISERTSRRFASGRTPVHGDRAEIVAALLDAQRDSDPKRRLISQP